MVGQVVFAVVVARLAVRVVVAGGGGGLQASAAEGGSRGGGVDPWVVSADCQGAGV